jgi:hypothetical protein
VTGGDRLRAHSPPTRRGIGSEHIPLRASESQEGELDLDDSNRERIAGRAVLLEVGGVRDPPSEVPAGVLAAKN